MNQPNAIKLLQQDVEDLKLAAWAFMTSSGCGCCANTERLHEARQVLGKLGADLTPYSRETSQQEWLKSREEFLDDFHELRKRLEIPTYEQEIYGEDDAD